MGLRSPPDRRAALGDKRVLVVEDEAIVAMLVEDELREAGAEVVGPAASVGGALRLIEAAAKDGGLSAAVLDINLQGRAVAPVADRLAALGVPFVFATGYGEGCDTGGHADARVLHKPFDPHALIDAVEALASARKGHGTSPGSQPFSGDGRPWPPTPPRRLRINRR
jgi:DNA-binding response OmpR family regulator